MVEPSLPASQDLGLTLSKTSETKYCWCAFMTPTSLPHSRLWAPGDKCPVSRSSCPHRVKPPGLQQVANHLKASLFLVRDRKKWILLQRLDLFLNNQVKNVCCLLNQQHKGFLHPNMCSELLMSSSGFNTNSKNGRPG